MISVVASLLLTLTDSLGRETLKRWKNFRPIHFPSFSLALLQCTKLISRAIRAITPGDDLQDRISHDIISALVPIFDLSRSLSHATRT